MRTAMSRERFFIDFLAAVGASLLLECPLLFAVWVLRTMPFHMLVDTLSGELLFAVGACPTGLEAGFGRTLSTEFTLVWVVAVP